MKLMKKRDVAFEKDKLSILQQEEWKFVSRVMDRFLFIVFFLVALFFNIIILTGSPFNMKFEYCPYGLNDSRCDGLTEAELRLIISDLAHHGSSIDGHGVVGTDVADDGGAAGGGGSGGHGGGGGEMGPGQGSSGHGGNGQTAPGDSGGQNSAAAESTSAGGHGGSAAKTPGGSRFDDLLDNNVGGGAVSGKENVATKDTGGGSRFDDIAGR